MVPTVENFAQLSAAFAQAGGMVFPGYHIAAAFIDLHYPDHPEEMRWLIGNLFHKKYSREAFLDPEWIQGIFDWLKPQTDTLYETIKAMQ